MTPPEARKTYQIMRCDMSDAQMADDKLLIAKVSNILKNTYDSSAIDSTSFASA